MLFLYKIWIINIDFLTLLTFVVGIIMGMVILCLVYAVIVVLSLRDKKYAVKIQANDLQATEAEEMIKIARTAYLDKALRGDATKLEHFTNVSKDLVYGIASRYFPDSKYPLLELTVDECLELIGYVQSRLDEILNKKVLILVRKLKVSDIMKLKKATTTVVDSKAFEVSKEVGKTLSILKRVVDTINPVSIIKKTITDTAVNVIMRKLYLSVITIIGEEAYKIYSKSFKNYADTIDAGVDGLVDNIETEIKTEIKNEIKNTMKKEETSKNEVSTVVNTNTSQFIPAMKRRVYIPTCGIEYTSVPCSTMPFKKKELDSSMLLPMNESIVED